MKKRSIWSNLRVEVKRTAVLLPLIVVLAWYTPDLFNHWQDITVEENTVACNDIGSLFGYEEGKYLHGQCYGLLDGKAVVVL